MTIQASLTYGHRGNTFSRVILTIGADYSDVLADYLDCWIGGGYSSNNQHRDIQLRDTDGAVMNFTDVTLDRTRIGDLIADRRVDDFRPSADDNYLIDVIYDDGSVDSILPNSLFDDDINVIDNRQV